MSQQGIIKILKELPDDEWISTKRLAFLLKVGNSSISTSIRKMRDYNEVESKSVLVDNYKVNVHRLTWKGRK